MAEEPSGPEKDRVVSRTRTFLKGIIYYDNRRVSVDCTVRDLSDTGARLALQTLATIPDNIELFIPQKQRTLQARVQRREPYEIGVSFEDQRSSEPRRAIDEDLAARVAKIEAELVAMRRLLKLLRAEVLPNETDL